MALSLVSLLVFIQLGASFCSAQSLSVFDLGQTSTVVTKTVRQADDATSGAIMMGMDVPIGAAHPTTAYVRRYAIRYVLV